MVFEHTINRLSFGYVCFPQLEYYFSCFVFFLFLLWLSTFKPLYALYSKFERLKIPGRTNTGMKSGVQAGGIPLNQALQNFELLNCWSYMDQIFRIGR